MRVTLDLDTPGQLEILTKYYSMKHICGVDEIRVSSGGNGLHFIKRGLEITYEQSLTIRATLGECSTRLEFDSDVDSLKPKSILWKSKNGKRMQFVEFPEIKLVDGEVVLEGGNGHMARTILERDLLALPFYQKLPREVFLRQK